MLTYKTKNNLVSEALRTAIIRNELKPGDRLREEEWAARLGVSPTPVREAFRELQAQGLVEILPHRGARVALHSHEELLDIFTIRSLLEPLATRLAIERSTPDELQRIRDRLTELTAAMHDDFTRGNHDGFREHNREAHLLLYEACHSPRLLAIIQGLWMAYPWDTLSVRPGRFAQTVEEHDALLDAVMRGDAAAAERAMYLHLRHAAELMRRTLADEKAAEDET